MTETHPGAGTGPGDAHFAVFPDRADAAAVARCFARPETRTLTYASGRPWLVGHWHDEDIVTARIGTDALALVGCCPVDTAELERRIGRLRDLSELDALARTLPGSFHLVAARAGLLRVQGTASGLRLVFHALVGGVRVAATSADVLADALGAEPDEEQVAVRLLWPVPHPLLEAPLWREVTSVPPEDALIVAADGRSVRHSRWWTPPEPTRSLADGAPLSGPHSPKPSRPVRGRAAWSVAICPAGWTPPPSPFWPRARPPRWWPVPGRGAIPRTPTCTGPRRPPNACRRSSMWCGTPTIHHWSTTISSASTTCWTSRPSASWTAHGSCTTCRAWPSGAAGCI